jgi:predicted nucleic acid-binding protein
MLVVGDTGPLYYLALIGQADVWGFLYAHMLVPTAVAQEMPQDATPVTVRSWISQPPDWIEIRPDPPPDTALSWLEGGESAAISLALSLDVERILIDDWDGRAEAIRRHLRVTGTLGILVLAHQRGLLDFETALARLSQTNFYLPAELVRLVRRRLGAD